MPHGGEAPEPPVGGTQVRPCGRGRCPGTATSRDVETARGLPAAWGGVSRLPSVRTRSSCRQRHSAPLGVSLQAAQPPRSWPRRTVTVVGLRSRGRFPSSSPLLPTFESPNSAVLLQFEKHIVIFFF